MVLRMWWGFVALSALGSYVTLIAGMKAATSAPQEAAVAASAVAFAVIPYVLVRAIEGGQRAADAVRAAKAATPVAVPKQA